MALIADNQGDRAEQIALAAERLTELVEEETRRMKARKAPLAGAEADEKNRLANTYRFELTRIKEDPSLIKTAPAAALVRLKQSTIALQNALAANEIELEALKFVTEGLVQAMAEEVARQRGGSRSYGARGGVENASGPNPALIDRRA